MTLILRCLFADSRAQACDADAGTPVAPCHLYFGCRGKAADVYYADQWQQYQQEGVLAKDGGLRIAFSRDGPAKRYVTHLLQEDGAHIWQLIQQVRFAMSSAVLLASALGS